MEIDLTGVPINNPIAFAWWFFRAVGWIYPVFLFCYGLILAYQNWLRNNYRKQRKYILLAIDIPKNNEQTPRAVENIFSHLSGAHQPLKWYQNWWTGEIKDSFSFEIVSIGGYIQFIVHLVDKYRDLVEAVIYAQYPDAEITEIEDYTKHWNIKFPNDKYNLLGSEIVLAKNQYYPIITYKEFEDSVAGDIKDPMASILEAMTRIGPGEEMWLQYVITPADNDWGEGANSLMEKLKGAKVEHKKTILDYLFDIPNFILEGLNPAPASDSGGAAAPPNQIIYLTQGEKDTIGAIEHKTGKIGFHARIRFIYIAEKRLYTPARGSSGLYGAFKQFNDLGLNSLKPDAKTYTGGIVFFKQRRLISRRNRILYRYKSRGHWLSPGDYGKILNTEELASLWHFPLLTVKAPLVKKTEAKRSEAPIGLPVETRIPHVRPDDPSLKSEPPRNLPTA
ncbi:MAG: hypothetical protein HUU49_01780 [Candidatus Buchananbacteria bacterium]|nr:hypothetical protein [Candidatus Buchananbacteria bacterium]